MIIFVHGVNSEGEWYDKAERALCDGLNKRLFLENSDNKLEANEYVKRVFTDNRINYLQESKNSPVIRFYWGGRAGDDDLGHFNDKWRKGEESLWMRFAKPYSGETYGMHFPLIDGTEVAVAFTEGNPDRPYIAHGMHDSRHPDLATAANHKRNVIRTPANLRMDDERGKEHIKVSTGYGKTQLNLGHLVDSARKQRGEGFELRTDEWGAIRAGKVIEIN